MNCEEACFSLCTTNPTEDLLFKKKNFIQHLFENLGEMMNMRRLSEDKLTEQAERVVMVFTAAVYSFVFKMLDFVRVLMVVYVCNCNLSAGL